MNWVSPPTFGHEEQNHVLVERIDHGFDFAVAQDVEVQIADLDPR